MRRRKLFLFAALLCAVSAFAQDVSVDWAVWGVVSPSATDFAVQKPQILIRNTKSAAATGYTCGLWIDGVFMGEKSTDKTVSGFRNDTIAFDDYAFELGKTYTIKAYVRAAEGCTDAKATNDTLEKVITMPSTVAFPLKWAGDTVPAGLTAGGKFTWESSQNGYLLTGKSTNWSGSITSDVIQVSAGQKVKLSFDYLTSTEVKFTVKVNYGLGTESIVQFVETEPASTVDYTNKAFTFEATKDFSITISAAMTTYGYGSCVIRNVNVEEDVPDLKAVSILSPIATKLAIGTVMPIKAKFRNVSSFDIAYPTFGFKTAEGDGSKMYAGTIAGGEEVDYTYSFSPLNVTAEKAGPLTVFCSHSSDANTANDSCSITLEPYEAASFPYIDNYDSLDERYNVIDANGDGVTWQCGTASMYTVAKIAASTVGHNDYLILPAVNMPAGKSRFTFYYASGKGNGHLRAYYGTTPDIDEMTPVMDNDVKNTGWIEHYQVLDIPTEGIYYFAFVADGTDELYIDNLHIDRGEDLCMNAITWSEKSGFNKTTAKVTLSYINYGMTEQSNITVKYAVNSTEFADSAVVTTPVAPGDTLFYTFERPFDISAVDSTYTLVGGIFTTVGDDQMNDLIYGESITSYANATVPYLCNFDDTSVDYAGRWTGTNTAANKWYIGSVSQPYDGKYVLAHTVPSGVEQSDDWVFSDCIEIPAGTYDFTFRYRTYLNFDTDAYQQNLKVAIGEDANAEAMTTTLFEKENFTVGRYRYAKANLTLNIAKDGKYYLGFYSNSPYNYSFTYIDEIIITPQSDGQPLPYASNFVENADEWTLNDPGRKNWALTTADDQTYMALKKTAYYASTPSDQGLLQSPKLRIEAGKKVRLAVAYYLDRTNIDTLKMELYSGTINNQDSMTLKATFADDEVICADAEAFGAITQPADSLNKFTTAVYEFTVPETGDYYFGFKSNKVDTSMKAFEIDVLNVALDYDVESGLADASLNARTEVAAEYFDLMGRKVSGTAPGVCIKVATMSDGSKVATKVLNQ
ncbi:MAG: hypothetical protein ACI30R_08405 [Sodaliphilus sp.]